ncbi:MAG: hypothetical protein AAGG75_07165 [Bacteroidota bacterium]
MLRYIVLFWCLMFTALLQAQTLNDAIRYSNYDIGGTARAVSVGGSLGALGADFSVLSTNPAGLAQYRSSQFMLTPSLFFSETSSQLRNATSDMIVDNKTNFNLNNLGFVLHSKPRGVRWKTFNIGIGFNRLANFNQQFLYRGTGQGSIVDRWVQEANTFGLTAFEAGPAFDALAIYEDNSGRFTSDFELAPNADIAIEQEFRSSGSMNELVLSLAGNYNEKLLLGATIGVPFISYDEKKIYRENNIDSIPFFNELIFEENLTTSGVGINLKLGMIYRFNQTVRVGLAIHTPTAFGLTDNFNTSIIYDFTDASGNSRLEGLSPEGNFEYRFRTPWRIIGSAGFLIKKRGFISAEVEWVDYTANNFNLTANSSDPGDRFAEEQINGDIDNFLASRLNIRLGGEYALKQFRFRAGYIINGAPFEDDSANNNALSFGLGLQERSFYIDLAYRLRQSEEIYVPYQFDGGAGQVVDNEVTTQHFLMTVGFRF